MVEVYWAPGVEAYVTPVSSHTIGVALLFYPDSPDLRDTGGTARFDQLLSRIPTLTDRLTGMASGRTMGAGPFEQRLSRRVAGRVMLVGDAAGYLDPLTGEGLRIGFETAEAAVHHIVEQTPARYERAWHRITRRYRWSTGGLLYLTRSPWRRRRLVPLLERFPGLMQFILGSLVH